MTHARWISAAIATVIALAALPALAQTAPQSAPPAVMAEARALFEQGVAAADAGRYADAVTAFERSLQLRASPVVLHNLAMAYRGVGRLLEAIATFERFLASPGRASRETIAEMTRNLESARAEVPELRFEVSPPDARVTVDGRVVASLSEPLRLDPGRRVVEVTAEDHVSQRFEFELQRSERRAVRASLELTPADARVAIESNVDEATIAFDGRVVGRRRALVDATPGAHRVVVEAPGYRRVERSVSVGRHGTARLDIVLQRGGGVPGWAVGLMVGGGVALAVAVTVPAVVLSQPIEPAPLVTPPNYWGRIELR